MLGYTEKDLNDMINGVLVSLDATNPEETDIIRQLNMANDFLQGLWAEGYFD